MNVSYLTNGNVMEQKRALALQDLSGSGKHVDIWLYFHRANMVTLSAYNFHRKPRKGYLYVNGRLVEKYEDTV